LFTSYFVIVAVVIQASTAYRQPMSVGS